MEPSPRYYFLLVSAVLLVVTVCPFGVILDQQGLLELLARTVVTLWFPALQARRARLVLGPILLQFVWGKSSLAMSLMLPLMSRVQVRIPYTSWIWLFRVVNRALWAARARMVRMVHTST